VGSFSKKQEATIFGAVTAELLQPFEHSSNGQEG
jgi:hypothetical protein